jgi:hypothetical protein
MFCLFCKCPSEDARSVEHIIPESLGNTRHVLPRGSICDNCNNYFAREVEGPVLSHRAFRNLRAWNRIPSKKGRLPSLVGAHFSSEIDIALHSSWDGSFSIGVERERDMKELSRSMSDEQAGGFSGFGFNLDVDPPPKLMSRFLAKMALEKVFLRLSRGETSLLQRLVFDPHYDRIRFWARRGDNFDEWPFHQRRVMPEETLMRHPETGRWVQIGLAHDLLLTARPETYFAISLYGVEFVINVGGPSIKGYEQWLRENNDISPLVERVGYRLSVRPYGRGLGYFLEEKT